MEIPIEPEMLESVADDLRYIGEGIGLIREGVEAFDTVEGLTRTLCKARDAALLAGHYANHAAALLAAHQEAAGKSPSA